MTWTTNLVQYLAAEHKWVWSPWNAPASIPQVVSVSLQVMLIHVLVYFQPSSYDLIRSVSCQKCHSNPWSCWNMIRLLSMKYNINSCSARQFERWNAVNVDIARVSQSFYYQKHLAAVSKCECFRDSCGFQNLLHCKNTLTMALLLMLRHSKSFSGNLKKKSWPSTNSRN